MLLPTNREKKLRELLRQARLDGQLRQVDLADALGKPQSFVAKVESGERTLSFIETLDYCKALGQDPLLLVTALK